MSAFVSTYPCLASPFFTSSFSVSLLFFIFRPSFLSFFVCFLLVPFLSLYFLSSLHLFHEKNNMKLLNLKVFHQSFHFWVFSLVLSFKSLFLVFVFPDFSLRFLFNINAFAFKNTSEKRRFLKKGGVQQNAVFFYEPLFCKMWKVIVIFGYFFSKFWLMLKHYKNRYFSTSLYNKWQKYHFEVLLSGPSRCYDLGQVRCNLKMANLAQIITPQICARNFVSKTNVLKPLLL